MNTQGTVPFKYDVFIAHGHHDKQAAQEVAERLSNDGLKVWLEEWEVKNNHDRKQTIANALQNSRTLALLISSNISPSEWVILQRNTIPFRHPAHQARRFVPIMLDNVEIKEPLKQFTFIDWRQKAADEYAKLLSICRPPSVTNLQSPRRSRKPKIFKGHTGDVVGVAITPDGRRIVSSGRDGSIRIWDTSSGKCISILKGHKKSVRAIVVTPDGANIISGSGDKTIRAWDLRTLGCTDILEDHRAPVMSLAVTPDGHSLVSGSADRTIRIWDLKNALEPIAVLEGHRGYVLSLAVMPDGRYVVSGSQDATIRIWDLNSLKCVAVLEGHYGCVNAVSITPDGQRIVSGSEDKTLKVWMAASGRCIATLEGHTGEIWSLKVTSDGHRIISGSEDKTIRIWDADYGQPLAVIEGHTDAVYGVALTPDGRHIISVSTDRTVQLRQMPSFAIESDAARYTNAKVLLVGETGVGKSGLALRLTRDRFEATISSDGVWATQMKLPYDDIIPDMEREIWLWDFAGQSDSRLIHQLFMDETALAVLVFNPQNENPFEGLGQWDRDLHRAARKPFNKLLVAGRCDRGGMTVSRQSIEQFRTERGFACYLETSAYTGSGCRELRDAIIQHIAWADIPWIASPRIFKILKQEIMKLRDSGKALLRISELKQQLDMHLSAESFTLEQLRTVIALLAGPGVVWQLEFGDFVLLQPEIINAYAAAVIRSARDHTEEMGCISEDNVLGGILK